MTDTHGTRRALISRIVQWAWIPSGRDQDTAWRKVEIAIAALANVAHSQGHAEARRSATDWTDFYVADINRSGRRIEKMLRQQADMSVTIEQQGVEIEHLKTEPYALRTLLEEANSVLAGSYHARTCRRWPFPHSLRDCPAACPDTKAAQPDPGIEAVLIGSRELRCADGCGRVVKQGNVMYRHVKHILARPPLYATRECVGGGHQPTAMNRDRSRCS